MKFLVDEMPIFYYECPFIKEESSGEGWVGICTLNNKGCNLHDDPTECYGLKELERSRR